VVTDHPAFGHVPYGGYTKSPALPREGEFLEALNHQNPRRTPKGEGAEGGTVAANSDSHLRVVGSSPVSSHRIEAETSRAMVFQFAGEPGLAAAPKSAGTTNHC